MQQSGTQRPLSRICSATTQLDRGPQTHDTANNAQKVLDEPAGEQASGRYVWTTQWYPVRVAEDLHTDRPNAVKLLGKDLVIWRDAQNQWRCFEDACPHRFAMLSEGRIEADGTLACAYHGWRFDGEGKCTTLPQSFGAAELDNAISNKKSCAVSYPVQVKHHLVWVWPDAGPNNHLEAMAREVPVAPELLDDTKCIYLHPWYMRELPYGFETLLENLVDPSHVPFTHSGIIGDRTSAAIFRMTLNQKATLNGGFAMDLREVQPGASDLVEKGGKNTDSTLHFVPPTLTRYNFGTEELPLILMSYCTPIAPGHSRLLYCLAGERDKVPKKIQRIVDLVPGWAKFVNHFTRGDVLDGDNVFLHGIDRKLNTEEGYTTQKYYTPTTSDLAVRTIRNWLENMASPVPWPSNAPADMHIRDIPREELLNRYHQHTKHCKNCSQALTLFTWAQKVALGGSVLLTALSGSAALADDSHRPLAFGLLAGAVASGLAAAQLSKVCQKFIFVDYVQQDH
ncbi:hypothetical protein ABBQ38_011092 [Trebouxia sp. C0009 RCD-2024]